MLMLFGISKTNFNKLYNCFIALLLVLSLQLHAGVNGVTT